MSTSQQSARRKYQEKYAWRVKNNICTRCGSEPPEEGKIRCVTCNKKEQDRKAAKTKCKCFKQNGLIKTGQSVELPSISIYG